MAYDKKNSLSFIFSQFHHKTLILNAFLLVFSVCRHIGDLFNSSKYTRVNIRGAEVTPTACAHLSSEMLQSMTLLLLVLTMMKGRCMAVFGAGALLFCCSAWRLRCTRLLKAICCKSRETRRSHHEHDTYRQQERKQSGLCSYRRCFATAARLAQSIKLFAN